MTLYDLEIHTRTGIPTSQVSDIISAAYNAAAQYIDVVVHSVRAYDVEKLIVVRFETAATSAQVQGCCPGEIRGIIGIHPLVVAGAIVAAIAAFIAIASWNVKEVVKTPAGLLIAGGLALFGIAAVIYAIRRK